MNRQVLQPPERKSDSSNELTWAQRRRMQTMAPEDAVSLYIGFPEAQKMILQAEQEERLNPARNIGGLVASDCLSLNHPREAATS